MSSSFEPESTVSGGYLQPLVFQLRRDCQHLRSEVEHLEARVTTAMTELQARLQQIRYLRSKLEYLESVRAVLRTIREAGAILNENEVQAAIDQAMRHLEITNEMQQEIRVAYEQSTTLEGHMQLLRAELEAATYMLSERTTDLESEEAARSSPLIRYGDPFDKLVGAVPIFASSCPLNEVHYPQPPPPRSRRQFLGLSDRIIVQLRQARALAGLGTGLMDREIAYRVCNNPIEWGAVGSMIAAYWFYEMIQDCSD